MMTYYVTKPVTDNLKEYIEDNYETYLELMRTQSGCVIESIKSVDVDNDVEKAGRPRPFILIDPDSETVNDEGAGAVSTELRFSILISVFGHTKTTASELCGLYKDAFVSMVLSDDYMGGNFAHVSVPSSEYFPGGTANLKYVILELVITLETIRS